MLEHTLKVLHMQSQQGLKCPASKQQNNQSNGLPYPCL